MHESKRILLVENSANDVELILTALSENCLANEVVVVRDGEEALDYLREEGRFQTADGGQSYSCTFGFEVA